jgi:acetyl esterase/lipase
MQARDLDHPPFFPRFVEPEKYPAVGYGAGAATVRIDAIYALIAGYRPLTLDFYHPNTVNSAPVVLYVHGGAWAFGTNKLAHWQDQNGKIVDELLAAGFAVAMLDYRHSAEAGFPACVQDAHAAVRWLRHFAVALNIDANRIGVWGESAGGHIAAMVSMNSTDAEITGDAGVTGVSSAVATGVLWYAVLNFASMAVQRKGSEVTAEDYRNNPEAFLLGVNLDAGDPIVDFASPISHVSAASAPVLLLHGDVDEVVPAAQSVEMSEALAAAGRPHVLELVAGANHVFWGTPIEPQITRSVQYLKEQLG